VVIKIVANARLSREATWPAAAQGTERRSATVVATFDPILEEHEFMPL